MAIIYPSIETIKLLRQKPTEGELYLLKFIEETLDNTYEVFFQPFLNGDIPDIVIMRENSGVYIIEVKDWNLGSYRLTEEKNWEVRSYNGEWYGHQTKSNIYIYEKPNNYFSCCSDSFPYWKSIRNTNQ